MGFSTGKRVKKRIAMNQRLKERHIENGYPQTCELKLGGCLKSWACSWAHSKKGRFIQTDDDWMTAVLACVHCHNAIELLPRAEMEKVVLNTIAARKPLAILPSED